MHALKTTRLRLAYDWSPLWAALLSLATFLAVKFDDLHAHARLGDLVDAVRCCLVSILCTYICTQVLLTFDFAAIWGEATFFSQADAGILLYYELLRHADTVRQLAARASIARQRSASNLSSLVNHLHAALLAPANAIDSRTSTNTPILSSPASPASTSSPNIQASPLLDTTTVPAHLHDADAVLSLIRSCEDKLELVETPALEDVRYAPSRPACICAADLDGQAVFRFSASGLCTRALADLQSRRPRSHA